MTEKKIALDQLDPKDWKDQISEQQQVIKMLRSGDHPPSERRENALKRLKETTENLRLIYARLKKQLKKQGEIIMRSEAEIAELKKQRQT